jgi:acyl-CoA thioesterase FadM
MRTPGGESRRMSFPSSVSTLYVNPEWPSPNGATAVARSEGVARPRTAPRSAQIRFVVSSIAGESSPERRYNQTIGWQKSHALSTRVAWHDTDASGRIHFTAAFLWAEEAESGLFESAGIDPRALIDYPRRRVEAEYLLPLRFGQRIDVRIGVAQIGRTSTTLEWEVVVDAGVAVRGRHTIVRVDGSGRPIPIDDATRHALERGD